MAVKSSNKQRWTLSGTSLAALSMAVGMGVGGVAFAQDEAAEEEEIVVTGFRGSLAASIDIKRDATTIVDSISAEDIGDFPDLNLAESLQRVPGVQIDRDGGEGRSINVRGLSADFVRVQLNGMEALATTGGRDGRANRNRQFDFSVFASELFNNVTVSKSQEAAADEGSLGATVGLRTARPFDFDGFELAFGGQASHNDLSEQTDPRATFLISNRWLDGDLGALFSIAVANRNTFEEGSSSGRFRVPADDGCAGPNYVNITRCYQSVGTITDADGNVLVGAAARTAAANGSHPRIPRYGRIGYDRERLGATLALQWDPADSTRVSLDTLYAQFSQERTEEFLEVISFARETGVQGLRAVDLVSGVLDDNRNLVSGTFNDVDIRSEQRIDLLETEFIQSSLNIEHDFSDRFSMSALVGLSRAMGRNPQQTTISFERYDVDGYSYDYSDPNLPEFDYGFDVTNPANWVYSASTAAGDASLIRLRPNKTLNTYETARVDFEYEISDALSLSFGASTKEFGFDVQEWRRASEALPASVLTQLGLNGYTIADYSTTVTGFGSGMDLPAGTPTTWVVPDLNALNNIIDFDCNCINSYGDFRLAPHPAETRSAYERSNGAYVQLDWNTELAGIGVRGNVGVRYVETNLTSTGILSGNEITVENSYSDTLPSLNFVVEPVDNLLIRFAAAKTMARPSLDSLTPGGSVDASPPGLTLNTGNPFLDPIRSTNLDLSIEYYPYDEALFSVAFFSKEIDSFVQRLRRNVPYSDTGFPLDLLPVGVTGADIFEVTSWLNSPGGDLTGYEITLQTPFSFLPAPFSDFGTVLNYTSIESEFDYITDPNTGNTVTESLVGQSPTSWSATLYYEHGPFEARVSGTYRDEYLTLVPAQNGNDVEGKAEQMNVDFSASYDVNERLTFSFEALNLTDQYDERWINTQRKNSLNYEHTGREFVVGFRYNY
ncbi:TonB-dependent receptor [Vitreimonas flagellata]|uniref:TonB-dependent receptor n=1 Tax=Vitreimonas flagellata TaxID=2560861 RepID=UPI001EF8C520|nr:TonB-dependent receptor [Vitreimonas flagellata]